MRKKFGWGVRGRGEVEVAGWGWGRRRREWKFRGSNRNVGAWGESVEGGGGWGGGFGARGSEKNEFDMLEPNQAVFLSFRTVKED